MAPFPLTAIHRTTILVLVFSVVVAHAQESLMARAQRECADRAGKDACQPNIYSLTLQDPVDREGGFGTYLNETPIPRDVLKRAHADFEQLLAHFKQLSKEGLQECSLAGGERLPCAIEHRTDMGQLKYTFAHFQAPFPLKLASAVRVKGERECVSTQYNGGNETCLEWRYDFSDIWRSWVPEQYVSQADRDWGREMIRSALNGQAVCSNGECSRSIVVGAPQTTEYLIATCRSVSIQGAAPPPDVWTCHASLAFDRNDIWFLAITKVLQGPGPCLREPLSCAFAGAYDVSFELARGKSQMDSLKRNQTLVDAVLKKAAEVLRRAPWNLETFEFDPKTFSYAAVSGRRRSSLIEGFEEFKLWVHPILKADATYGGWAFFDGGGRPIGLGSRLADVTFKQDDRFSVSMSLNVELYVSRYNTNDNTYWTKPTEAQELQYRSALLKSLESASQQACSELKLKPTLVDGARLNCQDRITAGPPKQFP